MDHSVGVTVSDNIRAAYEDNPDILTMHLDAGRTCIDRGRIGWHCRRGAGNICRNGDQMRLIQLFGGPGAGKTTLAAYLFYRFKKAGFRAELVGEAARELIYDRNPDVTAAQLLDNQLLISGLQYERIKRLERHGIEIAITDSPLSQGLIYAKGLPEECGLAHALFDIEQELRKQANKFVINIFVRRKMGVYDKESRAQSEKEAILLDTKIWDAARNFDYTIGWNYEVGLADDLIKRLRDRTI